MIISITEMMRKIGASLFRSKHEPDREAQFQPSPMFKWPKRQVAPYLPTESTVGKTSIVTGANSGIGLAVATKLAKMGGGVVLVCRDQSRGEAALESIRKATGNENVELMVADLASLQSVRKLASDFLATREHLELLVNNAGVIIGERTTTVDGLETTFVVNYLSHFLLTNLLLDLMRRSAPSRIVNVTSDANFSGRMDFDDLQEVRRYRASRSYAQSKLAQVLFTHELAKRLAGTGVTVNSVHPGAVRTHWGDEGGLFGIGVRIARPFMASPEKGARTPLYVATSPEVEGISGKYFSNMKETQSSGESYDEAEAKRLWDVSLKLTGLE